ncbi:MAG: hypothetical protein ACKO4Y_04895 [Flavobacteriales bacterium]
MKYLGCMVALTLSLHALCQDTTFIKSAYGGGSITVPEGVVWKITKALVNSGDGYNILISNHNFKSEYSPGEKIQLPYYLAEMELLDKKEGVFYLLYIEQQSSVIKK